MKNVVALFACLSILSMTTATASPIVFEKPDLGTYMGMNFFLVDLQEEDTNKSPQWDALKEALTVSAAKVEDQTREVTETSNDEVDTDVDSDIVVENTEVTFEDETNNNEASSDHRNNVLQTAEDGGDEAVNSNNNNNSNNNEESDLMGPELMLQIEDTADQEHDGDISENDISTNINESSDQEISDENTNESEAKNDTTEASNTEEATDDEAEEKTSEAESTQPEDENSDKEEEQQQDNLEPEKPVVGNPQAAGIIALLSQEVSGGLQRRHITDKFLRFRNYASYKLRSTAQGGSEVTALCRLKWYEKLYQNPLATPPIAEQFTRELHENALNDTTGLDAILATAAEKLDIHSKAARDSYEAVDSPEAAIEAVKTALVNAQAQYAASLAPLNQNEVNELNRRLYTVFTRNGQVGHTLSDRTSGRYLLKLILKSDRSKMVEGLRSIARLSDTQLLDQLAKISDETKDAPKEVPGVTGDLVQLISTSAGNILIGGRGNNTYQLDQLSNVNIVIDLGGNDTYHDGTCNLARPVFVTIDLAGDDSYVSDKPGSQGGSVLGLAMLLDREGNDTYRAQDVAQGSTLGGGAILIDYAGNDGFVGTRRVQGHAIGGIGLLINRGANDSYRAGIWAQGFGGPAGFGMIDDLEGKDHYFCGGLYLDSYEDTPGHEGWGQGVGAGIRQVANGGVGVMLDGGDDDVYEYDYMAQGGGYWLGVGFARDFGGNDQRIGATREQFNGRPRYERRFQRFSNGIGCHYALGFLIDDSGDDLYTGSIMGLGFAWDMAVGMLFDLDGNDTYTASGSTTKGAAGQAGLGILYDFAGKDTHQGRGQGYAPSYIDYHDLPTCGGNFAFLIDYGNTDSYSCGARNNSYIQQGSSGGFLIDRPKESEVQQAAKSNVASKGH